MKLYILYYLGDYINAIAISANKAKIKAHCVKRQKASCDPSRYWVEEVYFDPDEYFEFKDG